MFDFGRRKLVWTVLLPRANGFACGPALESVGLKLGCASVLYTDKVLCNDCESTLGLSAGLGHEFKSST